MRKKILFITNIPAPYRVDFFNELGKLVDLTVLFEAKTTKAASFNYNLDRKLNFHAVFLSGGDIREHCVDWKILTFLKRGRYDHIVVTNYGYATEAAAILALRARKIPYEMELDGGTLKQENPVSRGLKQFLIRGAERYWSTGEQTDRFLTRYGVSKERIVRYPFSSVFEREIISRTYSSAEKEAAKQRLGIPFQKVVLSVGRPLHLKGFDLLIRAASRFAADTGVVIVGGAPKQEWLALAKEVGFERLRFAEFSSKEDVKEYYRAADVFVLATRGDVWGLVVNEAMANGLPVVTTLGCVGGCEMIRDGENGYLIPCETWEPLAECVNRMLNNAELRECVALEGLKTVREYTVEAMARVHAAVFESNYQQEPGQRNRMS